MLRNSLTITDYFILIVGIFIFILLGVIGPAQKPSPPIQDYEYRLFVEDDMVIIQNSKAIFIDSISIDSVGKLTHLLKKLEQ